MIDLIKVVLGIYTFYAGGVVSTTLILFLLTRLSFWDAASEGVRWPKTGYEIYTGEKEELREDLAG